MSASIGSADLARVTELLALPYDDRQRIVIVSDTLAEAERRLREQKPDWRRLRDEYLKGLIPLYGPLYAIRNAHRLIFEAETLGKQIRNRALRVRVISDGEASHLRFGSSSPTRGVLYVGNPVEPGLYYPAAHFHRLTFEHKVSEAVWILACLGATAIAMEHISGWQKDVAAKLELPIPTQIPVQAGAGIHQDRRQTTRIMVDFKLPPLRGVAGLPPNLYWYPHEELWRTAVTTFEKRGMNELTLALEYHDDFNVSASLEASAQHVGLKLGGSFRTLTETTWKIHAMFKRPRNRKPSLDKSHGPSPSRSRQRSRGAKGKRRS